METARQLPGWVVMICGITTLIAILVSFLGMFLQISNYRKPFEQRLIVRILAVVPLFAISCYTILINYNLGRFIEPIREIYEAFVIYTFYKLLVLMLGGERKIILMTLDKPPTSHPFPTSLFLKKINISDPKHFLTIKRCILQYVWIKPLLYFLIFITTLLGLYDVNDVSVTSVFVWIGILYNISVTISLYSLAMFWKCLYDELSVFNPWRKFMCVKLIIFASYWQGLIIGLFNWLGIFKEVKDSNAINLLDINENGGNLGIQIQNGLLCFEMIFFAWLHWNSFPYTDFIASKIPDAARMETWHAMKDWIYTGDLIYDLKITTMYGDSYNLKNFDAITDSKVYNSSDTFNQKIYQGLRVSANGKKYWISMNDDDSIHKSDFNEYTSTNNNYGETFSNDNNESSGFNDSFKNNNNISNNNFHNTKYIENQAKILLGSTDKKKNSNIDVNTPLLPNPNLDDSPTKRGYLSTIDDLIDDNNSLIFDDDDTSLISGNVDINATTTTTTTTNNNNNNNKLHIKTDFAKDEKLYRYVKNHYLPEDKINYPVVYEYSLNQYSTRITRLRRELQSDIP